MSPDVFTAIGIVSALGATAALAAGWWAPAGLLLAARLAGANLDGAVARARGVARPWGFVLNEIGDRSGDGLMFAGLAVFAAPGMDATQFVAVAALERVVRILGVGVVIALLARVAQPWLRRLSGPYLLGVGVAFAALLALTTARWS